MEIICVFFIPQNYFQSILKNNLLFQIFLWPHQIMSPLFYHLIGTHNLIKSNMLHLYLYWKLFQYIFRWEISNLPSFMSKLCFSFRVFILVYYEGHELYFFVSHGFLHFSIMSHALKSVGQEEHKLHNGCVWNH